ncbi:fimbrial protein [Acinetobacter bereziniae]|uniref:fimbrial protein n=2 Tax=Acinetobacter bereziniae TaxID=106648 RepID=UPI0012503F1D|nr:fimbrial protein [Acinetobacter bereziniae]QQC82058.1 fimbrial protein [Acinetobacter bereziniae]UUN95182.1 fimbrial protein [Acinetobacter bereziniae]
MNKNSFICIPLLVIAIDASAGWWREEQKPVLYADFGTETITNPNSNQVGNTFGKTLNVSVNGDRYTTRCNAPTSSLRERDIYMTADYSNGTAINIGGVNYMQVNDYLQASVAYTYNSTTVPVPSVNQVFGRVSEQCYDTANHTGNTTYSLKMRISKPFMGFSYVDVPVADFYVGDNNAPAGTAKTQGAKQSLHLRGKVVVPQSCEINNNLEIIHDFGNIGSYAFKNAGIGNQIKGVNKANLALSIKCNSFVPTSAPLSIRIQADNVGGPNNDIIMSGNPDIGFKMSDQNDRLVIPNNTNSKITFSNTNSTNIIVKAWPVSATGLEPKLGAFQARGYFRIDFE